MKQKRIIKSSKIALSFANTNKLDKINNFISLYSDAVKFYVDYLWNNRITGGTSILDIKNNKYSCLKFFSITDIKYDTILSKRALTCAGGQALAMVNSSIKQIAKLQYIRSCLLKDKKRTRYITKKINKTIVIKPKVGIVNPEIDSKLCKIADSKTSFNKFLKFSSLYARVKNTKNKSIYIPINYTSHFNKLLSNSNKTLGSFILSKNNIEIRFEMKNIPIKTTGIKVGADQGINTCLTLSDSQTTKKDIHEHDLHSITTKISKKKTGSKAFHKAKDHQRNYINWSINNLNFSNIKQINLEKISNFRNKKNVGKFLNHFNETSIRNKLKDKAQELGVLIVEQDSAYMSRRCSKCGYTNKQNRLGKLFSCKHCTYSTDADYNASCNHEQELPSAMNLLGNNIIEFFWNKEGFYDKDRVELRVPLKNK